MIRMLLFFLITLMITGCSTLQVQSDYDPEFDFSRFKTFAVVPPTEDGIMNLTPKRIAAALEQTLTQKGYRAVPEEQADFLVLFHTNVTDKSQLVTDYEDVGFYPYYYPYYYSYYYPYYRHWPMMVPVQREYHYTESKIIIDALDPKDKTVFWRSVATDELDSYDTPQERIVYIHNVIDKALKSFPDRRMKP